MVLADKHIYGLGTAREVITEEMIRDVYGVHCRIVEDEHGRFIHPFDAEI